MTLALAAVRTERNRMAEPPPLPDLPPFGPTLVERGDAEHCRSAAQRQRERIRGED